MPRLMTIPPQYTARFGMEWTGKSQKIIVDADSDSQAAVKLIGYGIPWAAAKYFVVHEISDKAATSGQYRGVTKLSKVKEKKGRSLVTQATGAELGQTTAPKIQSVGMSGAPGQIELARQRAAQERFAVEGGGAFTTGQFGPSDPGDTRVSFNEATYDELGNLIPGGVDFFTKDEELLATVAEILRQNPHLTQAQAENAAGIQLAAAAEKRSAELKRQVQGDRAAIGSAEFWANKPPPDFTDPDFVRSLFPQEEAGGEDYGDPSTAGTLAPSASMLFDQRDGAGTPASTAFGGGGGQVDTDQIIGMFFVGGRFGDITVTDAAGVQTLNPLLASLLDMADNQNGTVSLEQVARIEAESRAAVAAFMSNAEVSAARLRGDSDVEIANIRARGDQKVVDARASSAEAIAGIEMQAAGLVAGTAAGAQKAVAKTAAGAQKAVAKTAAAGQLGAAQAAAGGMTGAAEFAAGGQVGAAEAAAGGQLAAAQAAAGASGPFGFLQQGGYGTGGLQQRQDLKDIFGLMNQPSLAAAEANRIGAQGNVFGLAAGQQAAGADPLTTNQIAQLAANSPAALAARGQIEAAQAQATPFGALSAQTEGARGNANAILRAQAANNPYAIQQLGQGWSDTGATGQNLRIDQILRGGLTANERLAEITAGQSGQNQANFLNFIGNPSAVGFATERGLFGGGNNQILQDINNSPEGNMPGSLFGFNAPTAAGAGGGQTTTVNTDNFNPNLSTTRNWSPEQTGFYQGVQSAGGQTPGEVQASMESFTPQGV